jgi:protoporphyrinogen oxidase
MNKGSAPRVVIIGSGPTGLGAAWRLAELQHNNWAIVDRFASAGGLASSITDSQGFLWDLGGHVLFSHYDYFDQLLDYLMADEWLYHIREAWVWIRRRFIPYPLQNNIWRLPPGDLNACLSGLEAIAHSAPREVRSFEDWLFAQFGKGLADVFFLPYNFKVWAYEPKKLDVCWMQERVATIDLARIKRNMEAQQDDLGWGPNARFRFPLRGGTGEIWRRLGALLPEDKRVMGNAVVSVDAKAKQVTLLDGSSLNYDHLISTLPLDILLQRLKGFEEMNLAYQDRLLYSSTNLIGVGLYGQVPEVLRTKCWMYFAEPDIPFYRATVFSNYSPNNVPDASCNWSLLCEVSQSPDKPVESAQLPQAVLTALKQCDLLREDQKVVSLWQHHMDHGYPTPFLGRDSVLTPLNRALEEVDIYSRGRFGAWKYEVSNQDHCLMQGVELVDRLLLGGQEKTFNCPSEVNSQRNSDRQLEKANLRL